MNNTTNSYGNASRLHSGSYGSASHLHSESYPVKQKKRKKRKKHPKFRLAMKISLLVVLLAILVAMGVFYFKYGDTLLQWQSEAKQVVKESTVDTFKSSETSIVYASNKKAIAKLKKGDRDAYYLTIDQIPQWVQDAFIVTEDRDYYSHKGFDPKALMSAAVQLVRTRMKGEKIARGGSTITQQLARRMFLNDDQTYERKIREIFIAIELEKKYTKQQILEFYINNVFFSNGYYGIEAAARGYFSKPASELSLSEVAFLCSIPNSPSRYDPLDNFSNTVERKKRILDQMLAEKVISAADYSDAYYEDVVLNPATAIKTQDYMTTFAVKCATEALMSQKGFKFQYKFDSDADRKAYDKEYQEVYDECNNTIYTAGYQIYTSLSKKMQSKLQKSVNTQLAGFTEKTNGTYAFQGAATCISNKTGRVVAIVGGRKQKSMTGYTLNRGYQSYRQPGSCFKPIVVYTPQLERGYTANSIVDDSYFEGGPRNADGRYLGKIPLRTAVEKSKNVVAWRLFEELTPAVGLSYAVKMNFSKIVDSDYYPASSLGGLTNGASTVEMASAYATLANDGKYRTPTCIVKILDSEGNVVVSPKQAVKQKRIYKEDAARNMTDILEGVMIRGTAAGKGLSNMASAGKTGTTSDKKDGWFCGYTPYYTTAVWVGYDAPKAVSNLYGSTYPLYIWHEFMEEVHTGLQYTDFQKAQGSSYQSSSDPQVSTSTAAPDETIDPDAADVSPEPTASSDAQTTQSPEDSTDNQPAATADKGKNDSQGQATKAPSDKGYDDVGDETTVEDVGN